MYIETIPNRSSPAAVLLRQSVRVGKKVKKKTLANLSKWPTHVVDGLRKLLKGEPVLSLDQLSVSSGKNFGGLYCLRRIAQKLFIERSLGNSKEAALTMLMILGRILTQGSRRHLKFWQEGQAVFEVLGIKGFDEDDLYEALDWLEENQAKVEAKLFAARYSREKVKLFLYDITSSYLEGDHNQLATYGYNRDGKKGKKQIVIGLLTDKLGYPIAIEVFRGNTTDASTVAAQVKKMCERFGAKEAIFVGDRGMVKSTGIEVLDELRWKYVTAITKPQIEKLLSDEVIQMDLFDEDLVEVAENEVRYILRRNPVRAKETQKNRGERMKKIVTFHSAQNQKLAEKKKANAAIALRNLNHKIAQLKLGKIFHTALNGRLLILTQDDIALSELSRLDGCYVIKTNVTQKELTTNEAHATYKNLAHVEWAFRTMKTGFLEIRPLYHRKANRTKACAFVAMLAYMILHHIWILCQDLGMPLEHITTSLDQIQLHQLKLNEGWTPIIPSKLRADQTRILKAIGLSLPKSVPFKDTQNVPSKLKN